jgi:Bacterial SH3 domain
VRRVSRSQVGGVIALALLLTLAPAALAAVLNKQARLREGPSRHTPLVAWIEPGTRVDILGSKNGWYQVLLTDGRRGFMWGEHLDGIEPDSEGTAPSAASQAAGAAPTDAPSTLQDELQTLRRQIDELGSDVSLARREDVEALRDRVEQLTIAQRELFETLDGSAAGVVTPMDGTAVAAGAFFTLGGILGWVAAQMTRGRRDRRGRLRV